MKRKTSLFAQILTILGRSTGLIPLRKIRRRIVITGGVIYINFINGKIDTINMWVIMIMAFDDFQTEFELCSEGLKSLSYIMRCCIDENATINHKDMRGIGILLEIYDEKQNQLLQKALKEIQRDRYTDEKGRKQENAV